MFSLPPLLLPQPLLPQPLLLPMLPLPPRLLPPLPPLPPPSPMKNNENILKVRMFSLLEYIYIYILFRNNYSKSTEPYCESSLNFWGCQ
jgi:hypothetical protein